jgi:cytidylate kinase
VNSLFSVCWSCYFLNEWGNINIFSDVKQAYSLLFIYASEVNSREMLAVAIDGPAGAGKSTIARKLAAMINAVYVDTGAMYRALTYKALADQVPLEDEEQLVRLLRSSRIELVQHDPEHQDVLLDGLKITDEVREPRISQNVSIVAKHPKVREIMVELQRNMARQQSVVMDGRDIGTTVLPNAQVKIFLTASVEERARRRYMELTENGFAPDFEELKKEIAARDRLDQEREASPLKKANDAIEIDTTNMTINEVVEKIYAICNNV